MLAPAGGDAAMGRHPHRRGDGTRGHHGEHTSQGGDRHEADPQHDHHGRDDPAGQDLRQSDDRSARHQRQAGRPQSAHRGGGVSRIPRRRARAARARERLRQARDCNERARTCARGRRTSPNGAGRCRARRHRRRAATGRMTADERQGGMYVGLMSGTSLDGISAAVARFAPSTGATYDVELLGFRVAEYSPSQRERLMRAMRQGTAREYCMLAVDLGGWLADAAVAVIADAGVAREDIRAVGSHGHTLWHEPPHSTWQIDAPAVIAERTGLPVVSDFRVRDMAVGGQGAPLVTIADALLFGGGRWRALQNIGGIGNVSVVPPDGTLASVRAFDTGPGVGIVDAVTQKLFDKRYDVDGRIGASGCVFYDVVTTLLAEPYFWLEPPKSTGRELFDEQYFERVITLCRDAGATDADVVATAIALTARSIADAYRRFIPQPVEEVPISGGVGGNPRLVGQMREALAPLDVVPFDERYFDGEAKEAVAFALLAHLHLEAIPGDVPSATGARARRVLGTLTPANG